MEYLDFHREKKIKYTHTTHTHVQLELMYDFFQYSRETRRVRYSSYNRLWEGEELAQSTFVHVSRFGNDRKILNVVEFKAGLQQR